MISASPTINPLQSHHHRRAYKLEIARKELRYKSEQAVNQK